jgi:hypothetical protein
VNGTLTGNLANAGIAANNDLVAGSVSSTATSPTTGG